MWCVGMTRCGATAAMGVRVLVIKGERPCGVKTFEFCVDKLFGVFTTSSLVGVPGGEISWTTPLTGSGVR